MSTVLNDLKYRFQNAGIVEKLIYINIAIFVMGLLISSFSGLYNRELSIIQKWFALPSSLDNFIYKPWTLISYGFLHSGFLHILFNCIWLYFFGRLFVEYFTPKQLLSFYLYGTIFGGILFLLSMNYFPLFDNIKPHLVGASAGVSAIVIGIATYIPNYQVKFRFIGYVKLWHIATLIIFLDLIQLAGNNGGGHFSHLGGALFGFLYVHYASNKELNLFGNLRSFFIKEQKPTMKTVYKSEKLKTKKTYQTKSNHQKKIDIILDKIGKSGYEALSEEEKEFLIKQSKNR